QVSVWSVSSAAWLRGIVDAVYPVATDADGFDMPAGTVKVLADGAVKYVKAHDMASRLAKRPWAFEDFSPGDRVLHWSSTQQAWLDGTVQAARNVSRAV
ncbi:unnamed protein product, partial [Prorocentrum cordatum]